MEISKYDDFLNWSLNEEDLTTAPQAGNAIWNSESHKRYRTIITLLTLLTAINNKGQPRIFDRNTVRGPLEETLEIHDRLLNSITTLLVRNHDNIATAVNNAYKVRALQMKVVQEDIGTDDESEHQASESSKSATEAPPNIIAITTPQDDDNYAFVDDLYLLLEKGTSHIGERFGDWDELLAIP